MAADHFTIVANSVARDRALSYAAKGLFLNMAGHREGFTITEEFLARQSTDGVKTVRPLLGELRATRYIYRSAERTRYPAGTYKAAGKDISGALGPYTWFVTDKPEEMAIILAPVRGGNRCSKPPVTTRSCWSGSSAASRRASADTNRPRGFPVFMLR
jgi:hypothetical protein